VGNRLMTLLFLTVLGSSLLWGCAQDPKKVEITEQNKDTFMKDIKEMKGLTVEEVGLLYGRMMRIGAQEALGGQQTSLVGKTIGEVIEEERRLQADEKKKQEEQDRLAAEAKAKEEALRRELGKTLSLSVFGKSFLDSDPMAGRYDDYIILKCIYQNTGAKDIRAFTGRIRFTDLFGKEIFESGLTVSDPVKAGEKGTWEGSIEYNQFMDDHRALASTELKDMKVLWLPSEILFADGTRLAAENKKSESSGV
jgi:hypothetical protein